MTKATITRLFWGSLIAIAGALVLFFGAAAVAIANNLVIMEGPDVVGVEPTAFAWSMLALVVLSCLVMAGGGIAQLIAWIGAVLNTSRLADKTWFVLLLVLGLLSFGFIPMVVYVLAGPDETATEATLNALTPAAHSA